MSLRDKVGSVVFTIILTGGLVVVMLLGVTVEVTVVVKELGGGGDVVVVTDLKVKTTLRIGHHNKQHYMKVPLTSFHLNERNLGFQPQAQTRSRSVGVCNSHTKPSHGIFTD